jgi:hypothetical protein
MKMVHVNEKYIAHCVKCNVQICQLQIGQIYKVGFQICESCFNRLDAAYKKIQPFGKPAGREVKQKKAVIDNTEGM